MAPSALSDGGLLGTPQRKRAFGAALATLFFIWILSYSSSSPSATSSTSSKSSSLSSKTSLTPLEHTQLVAEVQANCSRVMNGHKSLLFEYFSDVFEGVRNIAIISMPDHQNKGDSAIWLAEQMLLSSLGINIVYQAGVKNFDMADLDATVDAYRGPHFAIVFHGGGNFGDLYHTEHNLKLNVMRAYPQIRTHIFPQSLKFRSDETTAATKQVLDQLEHATIAVRDQQSLEFANKHFAHSGFKVTMTPDIVFYMGYRPELREVFGKSTSDLLLFRRADGERTEWDWAGGAGRPGFPDNFVKTLSEEGEKSLSFRIGDWSGDFDLTEEELSEVDGSTMHYRAWKRSMQGFEWLAESEFIILDRLHGHIFSLVLGIPHILIDNKIGKLYDYYTTWTKDCPLGTLIHPDPTAESVGGAYKKWVGQGKISGASFTY